MVSFDEARANRLAAAQAVPQEWRELLSDLTAEAKAFDDALESKAIRYVKTPKGADYYDQPIGSPIRPTVGKPKIDYVRKSPKKRTSPSSNSSSTPLRSADVSSPDATEDIEKLTPGRRGREKARLQEAVKNGAGSYERNRLRDIERFERELDETIRNPKRNIDEAVGTDKSKRRESPTTPAASTPKPSTAPERPTTQRPELQQRNNTPTGQRSEPRPTADERAATTTVFYGDPSEAAPERLSDRSLRTQISALAKKKKLTKKDQFRAQALLTEFNTRNAEDQRSQARRLVGKSAHSAVLGGRLENHVKTLSMVDGVDWDCSHMSDADVDYFLAKCLRGRPTVDKLTQANALMTERTARLEADGPEIKQLEWETA